MNSIIRNSIYFLGLTFFAIYLSKFVGYGAQILAFWPIMLANATDHFILTKDILTYGIANLIWIMVFPSFVASYIEYKNQRSSELDWKYSPGLQTKTTETIVVRAKPKLKAVKVKHTKPKNNKSKKK